MSAGCRKPPAGKFCAPPPSIDDVLSVIELENPKLKGILDKRYARAQLPDGTLGELVDLVSAIDLAIRVMAARSGAKFNAALVTGLFVVLRGTAFGGSPSMSLVCMKVLNEPCADGDLLWSDLELHAD
jgi:hypothetical protein